MAQAASRVQRDVFASLDRDAMKPKAEEEKAGR